MQPQHQADVEFFTVFDSKSKSYTEPFPARNSDCVLRDFANAFRDPEAPRKNRYYQNAEDFAIFKIGNFDLKTGRMVSHNVEHVVNLHDVRTMVQPNVERQVGPEVPRALSFT